ncbi:hypothetical protein PoB_006720300 [Plakobranchus ocellatus]|uniref:Uncharacterized protein n=1 Tax=Plakobranchus ocellatus TaxID=259542 RepID=A0AAV4D949_9GAST|nr:hypothetical protein PoB_006720300 [Plakobranchus ocellatus]
MLRRSRQCVVSSELSMSRSPNNQSQLTHQIPNYAQLKSKHSYTSPNIQLQYLLTLNTSFKNKDVKIKQQEGQTDASACLEQKAALINSQRDTVITLKSSQRKKKHMACNQGAQMTAKDE